MFALGRHKKTFAFFEIPFITMCFLYKINYTYYIHIESRDLDDPDKKLEKKAKYNNCIKNFHYCQSLYKKTYNTDFHLIKSFLYVGCFAGFAGNLRFDIQKSQ